MASSLLRFHAQIIDDPLGDDAILRDEFSRLMWARNAAMPDVPTSAEVALPGLLSGVWYAMVGPPKLKPELQDQIAKATIEVLKMPDVQQRFRKLNVEPDGGTPAETAAFIKNEVRRWGEVIRANHIMAE
jgi:tripartite-type tricarboxylate transporter receptor subunit TctC